jgi:hypothetical protein
MTATVQALPDLPDTVQSLRPPPMWYRDTASCLPATIGSVLAYHGHDPLEVLGAGWDFTFVPGEPPFEEFYRPLAPGIELGQSLAPHHGLKLRWVTDGDEEEPLSGMRDAIKRGHLPVAAVDKFHLPFRPAYHDVHAANLLIVYGIDLARSLVLVADPTPPGFSGPIAVADFLAARQSANPPDEQDAFFSDTEIGSRYLLAEVPGEPVQLTRPRLGEILRANAAVMQAPEDAQTDGAWTGVAGLRRFLELICTAAAEADSRTVQLVYPFAWSPQASASLHGELLRRLGVRHQLPELVEAGRAVETVSSIWTALRVSAAHYWSEPARAEDIFATQGRRLQSQYEVALDMMAPVAARLAGEM